MCLGPDREEPALSDAQEEIRRLFDRYRHPAEPEPVEVADDEEAAPDRRDRPLVAH